MGERIITEEIIQSFHQYLVQEEKSTATIEKYLRDVRTFSTYIGYRMSSDEDILIPEDQLDLCHQAMLDYGMQPAGQGQDIHTEHEVPYGKPGSPLYIELHKCLFPPKSDAYGDLNRFFKKVQDRAVKVSIDGEEIVTMDHTDHLFYLICHAFKHFLHLVSVPKKRQNLCGNIFIVEIFSRL